VCHEDACLLIEIGNEVDKPPADFMPRSINERVRAQGGRVIVDYRPEERCTVVHVSLPF
jgi:signal transduction histidine kinase